MMYGYRGEFQNKVPLNYKGFSPGALVTLGWQFTRTAPPPCTCWATPA
jgi:hypothetical protein